MAKPWDTIELRHLRYFLTVAEHGSLRKAAASLNIQQSTLSRRIRDLEDFLGASLFHRCSSGVRLTYAGKRLLPRAQQIIQKLAESAEDIASVGRSERGCVRIGVYSSIASGFLANLLRCYGTRHENVRLEIIDGPPDEHVAAIRDLQLDVAFLSDARNWSDCSKAVLWSERIFAVLPEDNALTACEELSWHDLMGQAFIVSEAAPGREVHEHIFREISRLGSHTEIQTQSVGRDNLLSLVAIGKGLTLISEAMTRTHFPGTVYRPITGDSLAFSAVWSPRNDNPAFRSLLSMARIASRATQSSTNSTPSSVSDAGPSQTRGA